MDNGQPNPDAINLNAGEFFANPAEPIGPTEHNTRDIAKVAISGEQPTVNPETTATPDYTQETQEKMGEIIDMGMPPGAEETPVAETTQNVNTQSAPHLDDIGIIPGKKLSWYQVKKMNRFIGDLKQDNIAPFYSAAQDGRAEKKVA